MIFTVKAKNMKPDPDVQELVAKLKDFLAYCDDTSLPRPPGVTHEAIPVSEPEVK